MSELIVREQFEAWLFSQPRERVYKYWEASEDQPTGCVMSNYLRECTPHHEWILGTLYLTVNQFVHDLPRWFVGLMRRSPIDVAGTFGQVQDAYRRLYPDRVKEESSPVTPERVRPDHGLVGHAGAAGE